MNSFIFESCRFYILGVYHAIIPGNFYCNNNADYGSPQTP
jgi:hypothetical protein